MRSICYDALQFLDLVKSPAVQPHPLEILLCYCLHQCKVLYVSLKNYASWVIPFYYCSACIKKKKIRSLFVFYFIQKRDVGSKIVWTVRWIINGKGATMGAGKPINDALEMEDAATGIGLGYPWWDGLSKATSHKKSDQDFSTSNNFHFHKIYPVTSANLTSIFMTNLIDE